MASFGTTEIYTTEDTTQAFTCDSGTTILLVPVGDFGTAPSGVTYNGADMTLVGRATSSEGNVSWWRLYSPTTGSSQSIVCSGGTSPFPIGAVCVIDGDAVVDFDVANENDSNPLTVASFTTAESGLAAMVSLTANTDRPVTAYGTGESALHAPTSVGIRGFAISGKATDGDPTTMSHTKTGTTFWSCGIAVSVSEAGGGGSISFDEDYQISLPVISGW